MRSSSRGITVNQTDCYKMAAVTSHTSDLYLNQMLLCCQTKRDVKHTRRKFVPLQVFQLAQTFKCTVFQFRQLVSCQVSNFKQNNSN